MATVTGMTAEKINSIVNPLITGGSIDSATGVLTLQTRDGQTINVGNVDTDQAKTSAVNAAYPVGSIFMSAVATNPASLLGVGTWAAWGQGRVPVGVDANQTEFDASEKTGGEKTHTLSLTEMPRHSHTETQHSHSGAPHTHTINHDHASITFSVQTYSDVPTTGGYMRVTDVAQATGGAGTSHTATVNVPSYSGTSGAASYSGSTGTNAASSTGNAGANADGSTQPHNNLQPYITCYMWKRTA